MLLRMDDQARALHGALLGLREVFRYPSRARDEGLTLRVRYLFYSS